MSHTSTRKRLKSFKTRKLILLPLYLCIHFQGISLTRHVRLFREHALGFGVVAGCFLDISSWADDFSPQKTSPETNFLDMFRESICSLQKEKTQFLPAPCIERKKRPKASEKIIKELQIIQSQQRVSSSAELLTVATKVLLNSKVAAINKACPKALVSFCCSKISSQLSKCNGNKTSRI